VFPFGDIFPMILFNIFSLMFQPLFWLVVVLVGMQYRRINSARASLYGVPLKPNWNEVVTASMFGLAGGIMGSVVMVLIGVTLTGSGLIYILPLAILLMLINVRFICFAYAGGILAMSNILFGFPQVNVSQVLALVATKKTKKIRASSVSQMAILLNLLPCLLYPRTISTTCQYQG